MSLNLKSLHGLATVMYNAITTKDKPIRVWLESIFSPKSHTHKKSQITDFTHTHTQSQISDFSHTHTAAQVNVTASDVVSAATVQSHIEHLTKNKSPINHTHSTYAATDHTHTVAQITDASNIVTLPNYSSTISSGTRVMEYKATKKCWISAWNDGEIEHEALNFTVNGILVSYCGGDGRQGKSAFAPLGPGDVLRCIIVAYPPIPRSFNYIAYNMK